VSSGKLAIVAAACGLLAAWLMFAYMGGADRGDGPSRAVLVAVAPVRSGEAVDDAAAAREFMPDRFAPPDAAGEDDIAAAPRALADIPAGEVLTRSMLASPRAVAGSRLRRGERALTVDAVVSPAEAELAPGDRVDLYASGFGGDQRSELAISGAEVLQAGEAGSAHRTLTVRLASAQVAPVIRADVFAHELRAVVLPGGR
jgi:Flp pilus assembly protein CpaB